MEWTIRVQIPVKDGDLSITPNDGYNVVKWSNSSRNGGLDPEFESTLRIIIVTISKKVELLTCCADQFTVQAKVSLL